MPPGAAATMGALPRPATSRTVRHAAEATNIAQAAQKFEAMAIAQMLKPIFASAGQAAPPFGGGMVEKSFKPFLIDAVAKEMEARGGLGLAPMIEHALAADRAAAANAAKAAATRPHSTTDAGKETRS